MDFEDITYKLDEPSKKSKKLVILLPGLSGNALSDERYDSLSHSVIANGFGFLRFDLWKTVNELEKLSINDIHSFIDKSIEFGRDSGYGEFSFVGKSFGGSVLLTYGGQINGRVVLWAPAICFGDQSNLNESKSKLLSEFVSLDEIKMNEADLRNLVCPVLIVHGTKDPIVSIENSRRISLSRDNISLTEINGADHSYKDPEHSRLVIRYTVEFLKG